MWNNHNNSVGPLFTAGLLASAIISVNAVAQETAGNGSQNLALEEVTVTAQKRSQNLQDVPVSVQAITGENIVANNQSRLQDISDNMPNVTISRSSTSSRVYIRGIGSDSNSGFEQSVAMFSDGLYMGRGEQSKFPFMDIERIEVLRGPQSILFGKNATAGAFSIITKNPRDEFEAEVRAAAGEFGEKSGHVIVSGPVTDTLGVRVVGFAREFDGYMKNIATGENEERREEQGGRITALWEPSELTTVNLKYETGTFKTFGTNYQGTADSNYTAAMAPLLGDLEFDLKKSANNAGLLGGRPEANNTDLNNLNLKVDHLWGGNTLTSITTYSEYQWDLNFDADFSPLTIAQQSKDERFDQFSQELRLVTPEEDRISYIVGAYYQKNNLDIDTESIVDAALLGAPLTAGGLSAFSQDSETFAVFGEANVHLTDTFAVSLGLRWGEETKDVTETMVTGLYDLTPNPVGSYVIGRLGGRDHDLAEDRKESELSPSIGFNWNYSDDSMLYASIKRGYKGGGFDGSGLNGSVGSMPDESFEFDEEEVTAFELGNKSTLLDGRATLNWTLFHSIYDNLQVSTFNGASYVIGNAAQARSQGLEVEYRMALTEELGLEVNTALLDFEYKDFASAACTIAQEESWSGEGECRQDLSGRPGALTPELTASVSLDYAKPITAGLELRARLNTNYSDGYYTESDLDPNIYQDAYTKVNTYFALANMDDTWEVALIGKNITNELISSSGNDNPLFDFAYRKYLEAPRQWSLQGTYRF